MVRPVRANATQLGNTASFTLKKLKRVITNLEKYRVDIEKALCYGGSTHTFDYVCARVLSNDLDMFALPNSVILCEKVTYEKFSVYNVFIAGGNLNEILQFETDELDTEANNRGCKYVTFSGRSGWVPALKARGWELLNVNMMREVSHGQDT